MPKGEMQRVLLIDHPGGKRDDRASMRLAELGFELAHRRRSILVLGAVTLTLHYDT